jgi:membrane-bound serine protease (ClpP class)
VHVTGFGAFGIGGIISFILGLVFLLEPWAANPPDAGLPAISGDAFKPNLAVIVGLCTGFAAITGLMVVLVWRGKRTSALAGHPTLVGRVGRVTASLAPVGTVQLGGELWSAEEAQGQHVEAGEEVEVTSVDGLTLKVRRKTSAPGGSPGRTPA